MRIEKITWKVSPPATFPCFRCKEREAEYNVKIKLDDGHLHSCLCPECVQISELELITEFTTRRK